MFQRVLFCTELSDGIQRFVHFVPSLAAAGIRHLVFLHVAPLWEGGSIPRIDDERVAQAKRQLAPALEKVPPGIEVQVVVESGRAIDAILKVAKAHQSELIVMGTPIRNLLTEKLFGSTAIGLSQRTNIPIMALRPQLISTYTTEELDLRCRHLFHYLLIPYDDSSPAQALVEYVKQHPKADAGDGLQRCLLCWVVSEGSRREQLTKDHAMQVAKEKLMAIKTNLESAHLQVDVDIRCGDPISEILSVAVEIDITAIAVCSDSLGKPLEWSVPSFTGELLRRCWHPLIFFPHRG